MLNAAELLERAGDQARTLEVYRRYVERFPHPVEANVETRGKIAEALRKKNDQDGYLAELRRIVAIDGGAGSGRTPRTRALAAKAALVLAGLTFDRFAEVKLTEPVGINLSKKKELMKVAARQFSELLDYEVGDATAAAAFYLAELYADFSKDLKESERPAGLGPREREEYDLAIEEQAYPFEEKAIATHMSNLELISRGVYNEWIDKSLQKLVQLVPARYDKPEEESPVISSFVARPEDGRQGFVIREKPAVDAESRGEFERAAAMLDDGKNDAAIELLIKVIERSPGVTAPHIDLAMAYLRTGKLELAEQHLKIALELAPHHPVASNEYGLLLRRAGRFNEARELYEKALAEFPDYLPARRNLGILCDLYLNDPACALKQFEIYSTGRPADARAKIWIAELRMRPGRPMKIPSLF